MESSALRLRDRIDDLLRAAAFQEIIDLCKPILAQARKSSNAPIQALSLVGLSLGHLYLGKFEEARVLVDGALRFARQSHDPELEALALCANGTLHLHATYLYPDAESYYRDALRVAHQAGDGRGTAAALLGVAYSTRNQEMYGRSVGYAREAFELGREIGDLDVQIGALSLLAADLADQNQRERALKAYQDALGISEESGAKFYESDLLGGVGILFAESERYHAEGMEMLARSLELAQERNSAPQEYSALNQLGRAHERRGEYEAAQGYYETMLNRAQEWNNRAYESAAFYALGQVALAQNELDIAVDRFQEAGAIARETMNPFREAQVEYALGTVYSHKRDYKEAISHYMAARSIYDALDQTRRARNLLTTIVITYLNQLLDRLMRALGLRSDDDSQLPME